MIKGQGANMSQKKYEKEKKFGGGGVMFRAWGTRKGQKLMSRKKEKICQKVKIMEEKMI